MRVGGDNAVMRSDPNWYFVPYITLFNHYRLYYLVQLHIRILYIIYGIIYIIYGIYVSYLTIVVARAVWNIVFIKKLFRILLTRLFLQSILEN